MINPSLFLLCFSFLAPDLLAGDTTAQGYPVLKAQEGETCTVCGTALDSGDVALLVRGRRVPLDRTMVDEFLSNEQKYFARLQPRSALFQEGEEHSGRNALGGIDLFWFLVGFYALTAVIFSGLSAYVAIGKGLKPIPNFFIGLVLSAPGFLYVLTRPPAVVVPAGLTKVHSTSDPVSCGKCGSSNHPSARKCAHCGAALIPTIVSEVERAG